MLISRDRLAKALARVLSQRIEQGADIDAGEFTRRIASAAASYDALYALALELRDPPLRADWQFVEPVAWKGIVAEAPALDPTAAWPAPDLAQASDRARAGFLGAVCGCMLGKPLEVDPTLSELERAGQRTGEWPLNDYVSAEFLDALGKRHDSWPRTTRGGIVSAVADDDIHYTLLGMLVLETVGLDFSKRDLAALWSMNLAPGWTWGPERTQLLLSALERHHLFQALEGSWRPDVLLLNPGDELCGALIRADVYGLACPGNPDLAAWLAWKDASFTHIKTGVYGAMFVASLIALCHVADSPFDSHARLALVREALKRVPARSRFAEVVADAVQRVAGAADWTAGYLSIHKRYAEFSHCRVYQEIGTLVNTLRHAESIGHGICLQVSQGNDTDSFGAVAGAVLGALFGTAHLDAKWTAPLGNRVEHALAGLEERRLDALADRLAALPATVHGRFPPTGVG